MLHKEKCSSCGKANHFAAKCFKNLPESKKKHSQKFKHKKLNQFNNDFTESSYSSEEEMLSVSLDHTTHMKIANELVKMQVDSGASCNLLPCKFLPWDTEIKKTNLKLTMCSKMNLKVLGMAKISLRTRSIMPNLQSLMKITLHYLALQQHSKWD